LIYEDIARNPAQSLSRGIIPYLSPVFKQKDRIQTEKEASESDASLAMAELALLAHTSEALAAVNRTVGLRLEGNLSLTAAGSAGSGEELAGTAGSGLAGVTAGLAALGLVLEATLSVELLLAGGEHELIAAFLAYQSLVFVHCVTLSLTCFAQM